MATMTATNGEEALQVMAREPVDTVVTKSPEESDLVATVLSLAGARRTAATAEKPGEGGHTAPVPHPSLRPPTRLTRRKDHVRVVNP